MTVTPANGAYASLTVPLISMRLPCAWINPVGSKTKRDQRNTLKQQEQDHSFLSSLSLFIIFYLGLCGLFMSIIIRWTIGYIKSNNAYIFLLCKYFLKNIIK